MSKFYGKKINLKLCRIVLRRNENEELISTPTFNTYFAEIMEDIALGLEANDRYLLKIVKNSTIIRLSTYFYHYVSNTTTISGDIL